MSDREQLIDTYVATWNEVDADRRSGLMEQAWVDDAYYADPAVEARGRDAISDNIDRVHQKFPDRIFCRTSDVFVHRQRARFKWAILDPAGAAILAGVHYAEFADDGRLRRMIGVFDRTPDWPKLTRPVIRTQDGVPATDSPQDDFSGYSGQKDRFDSDTEVTAVVDGRFTSEVRAGWASIGAQANGGYLLALVLAATSKALPGLSPLTATVHYLKRSELGPAVIDVEVVKRGRMKTTVAATMSQESAERLRALVTYCDRSAFGWPVEFSPDRPDILAPEDCVAPTLDLLGDEASIATRFDYRVAPDTRWVRGATTGKAQVDGWIRFSDGRPPDLSCLPLMIDAFPPAIYEVVDSALVPTMELTVHLRQDPAPGWIQARFSTRMLAGGMLEEDGELWDSDGKLVAMSRQLALVVPVD